MRTRLATGLIIAAGIRFFGKIARVVAAAELGLQRPLKDAQGLYNW